MLELKMKNNISYDRSFDIIYNQEKEDSNDILNMYDMRGLNEK